MSTDYWSPAKILVVDDSATVRASITRVLRNAGHSLLEAKDGAQALWLLSDNKNIELILSDLEMPVLDGLGFLSAVRERPQTRNLPMIMISSVTDRERVVECLQAGANDFVSKPVVEGELLVRVRNSLALFRTIQELSVMAETDYLTGLYNKRYLKDLLDREMERSRRGQAPLSVIMADLDHFKRVNDNYGHQVGDEVLRHFAKRICAQLRPYDQVVRYGGEEFTVIMPGCGENGLKKLAERIRARMQDPMETSKGELSVTVSLGGAVYIPDSTEPQRALISRADQALYQAKETGRNRLVMAPPQVN